MKTRSLAARLVAGGHVRVNGSRADAPAKAVKPGDVLTIALDSQIRVLKVLSPGVRRGPYLEARTLFDDLSNPDGAAPGSEDDDDR